MKKENHPKLTFPLSPINKTERVCHVYFKPNTQQAEIYTECGKENQIVTPITLKDAIAIVNALRELFDLCSHEQQAIDLLDAKMQRLDAMAENMMNVAIVNAMYENGIRRAVLTPSRIVSGMVPQYTIESDRDQITYVLEEDPLNERTES